MHSPVAASLLSVMLIGFALLSAPASVMALPGPNDIYVGMSPVADGGESSCEAPDYSVDDADIQISLASAIADVDHDNDVIIICEGGYLYSGDIATHDGDAVGSHPKITISSDDGATVVLDGDSTIAHQLLSFQNTDVTISGITLQRGGNEFGGGISVVSTAGVHLLIVRDSSFHLNQATNGSAIYVENTDLSITNSAFGATEDSADTGLVIEGENAASSNGGAIYATGTGTTVAAHIEILNSTFNSNRAFGYGGAVMVNGHTTLSVTDTIFQDNQAGSVDSPNGCGGAIYLLNEDGAQISRSEFSGNHAAYTGGAITSQTCHTLEEQHREATVEIQGSSFSENLADCAGGAVESLGLVVRASVFSRNEAGTCAGGAIAIKDAPADSRVELIGNQFIENSLTGDACCEGGAIYVWYESEGAGARPVIRANTFRRNSSSTSGGAITLRAVSSVRGVVRNVFWANAAPRGGAISLIYCQEHNERFLSRRTERQILNANRFRRNSAEYRREVDISRNADVCPG